MQSTIAIASINVQCSIRILSWLNKRNESRRTHFELRRKVYEAICMLLLLPYLLGFFDVVFDHELAPECNLLTDKITQHFWVARHNLNALCF